ncbi:MAG: TrkH family potassium uptake protein [Candidatus Omnitrophota bacterium]
MALRKIDSVSVVIIILGFVATVLENGANQAYAVIRAGHIIDLAIFLLFVSIYALKCFRAPDKRAYFKKNILETSFIAAFLLVFVYGKNSFFFTGPHAWHHIPSKVAVVLSIFTIFKVLFQVKKLSDYFRNLTTHPARTIMSSFLVVIIVGTFLLMVPLATPGNSRIGFVDALFTATSATCVTGLTVIDTASKFSVFGKTIIMLLIQIGGLGIMILAVFVVFLVGRKLSLRDKLTMSYMLDEEDSRNIAGTIKSIVVLTFAIELCGAILLCFVFRGAVTGVMKTVFYSLFHAVSAFCNAGFALFPGNLARFRSSLAANAVIAGLIIAGGISFSVIVNSYRNISGTVRKAIFRRNLKTEKLNLNTMVVLTTTAIMIVAGTLLIYKFEHRTMLLPLDITTQYLMAFFQSVTLRTAGFNTMDISGLTNATYLLMILFMFIGGASGSTAGGIKVNSLGILWAYVRSVFTNKDDVVLLKHTIPQSLINQTFLVIVSSLGVVFFGVLLLSFTERVKMIRIIFEAVSAFGTVGLSTGITPELTTFGKMVIIVLMFIGRIGPLTVIMALSRQTARHRIRYPEGKINIG